MSTYPLYEYEGRKLTAYEFAEHLCYRKKDIDKLLLKYDPPTIAKMVEQFHEYHRKVLDIEE